MDHVQNEHLRLSSLPTLRAESETATSTGAFDLLELVPASAFVLMGPRPLWVPNEVTGLLVS